MNALVGWLQKAAMPSSERITLGLLGSLVRSVVSARHPLTAGVMPFDPIGDIPSIFMPGKSADQLVELGRNLLNYVSDSVEFFSNLSDAEKKSLAIRLLTHIAPDAVDAMMAKNFDGVTDAVRSAFSRIANGGAGSPLADMDNALDELVGNCDPSKVFFDAPLEIKRTLGF